MPTAAVCTSWQDQERQVISLGTPDYPVYVRTYAGGSGGGQGDARIGYQIELYTAEPKTYFSIDLSTFPLGLTPAVDNG